MVALAPLGPADPLAVGDYQLSARLGLGGMGAVYLGSDTSGRVVALKVMHDDRAGDADFRARFQHEVTAARAVDSPWVARLVDADTEAERPWIALEYVPGPNLAELIRETGPLPPERTLSVAKELAAAVLAIHDAGVVHRDLKPGNVVFGDRTIKVVDFGIAVAGTTALTRTGVVLGSLGYIAPEVLTGSRPGPAADIFSWGMTVAYAASGHPPFGSEPPEAVLYRTVHEEPDLAGVPEVLAPIVAQAVRKDASQRPDATRLIHQLLAVPATPPLEIPRPDVGTAESLIMTTQPLTAPDGGHERGSSGVPAQKPPTDLERRTGRHLPDLWAAAVLAVVFLAVSGVALTIGILPSGPSASAARDVGPPSPSVSMSPLPAGSPPASPPPPRPPAPTSPPAVTTIPSAGFSTISAPEERATKRGPDDGEQGRSREGRSSKNEKSSDESGEQGRRAPGQPSSEPSTDPSSGGAGPSEPAGP